MVFRADAVHGEHGAQRREKSGPRVIRLEWGENTVHVHMYVCICPASLGDRHLAPLANASYVKNNICIYILVDMVDTGFH